MRRILADLAILFSVMIIMTRASSMVGGVIRHAGRLGSAAVTASGVPDMGMIAGASDLVADATEVVAEEVAESVTAAARMAKSGLVAIAVSRPLTLSTDRKADVASRLRTMIFTLRRAGRQRREEKARAK
jgi:hypothetical protein